MRRVAVIGDSAMWGQGLRQEQKYAFKLVEWLKARGYGYELDPKDFIPHSGAIIGDRSQEALNSEGLPTLLSEKHRNGYAKFSPEVPTDYPSIYKQVGDLPHPETVELLIMNGGMNDVGMNTPVEEEGRDFNIVVHQKIREVVKTRLQRLLEHAHATFPNAQIMYTGYYPALGPQSQIPLEYYQLIFGSSVLLGTIFSPFIIGAAVEKVETTKKQALELYQAFHVHACQKVAEFNSEHRANVLFCHSGFKQENAIFGRGEPLVFGPGDDCDPEVFEGRGVYCKLAFEVDADRLANEPTDIDAQHYATCTQAYLLHPNVAGANQYAKTMGENLTRTVEFSLREALTEVTQGPLSIRKATQKLRFKQYGVTNIKQLLHFGRVHTLYVQYDLNIRVAPSDPDIFPKDGLFDFGWGKERIPLAFTGPNALHSKYALLEIFEKRTLSEIIQFQVFLPAIPSTINFSLSLVLYVNGYELTRTFLEPKDFTKTRSQWTWKEVIQ